MGMRPRIKGDDYSAWVPPDVVPPISAQQEDAACRVLASHAVSADELRDWLVMIGVLPAPAKPLPQRPAKVRRPVPADGRPTGPRLDRSGAVARCKGQGGHLMTADNTRWVRNGEGRWAGRCRACDAASESRKQQPTRRPVR